MEIYVYADMQQGLIDFKSKIYLRIFYFIFLIQDYAFSDTASPEKKYFQMNALFQEFVQTERKFSRTFWILTFFFW